MEIKILTSNPKLQINSDLLTVQLNDKTSIKIDGHAPEDGLGEWLAKHKKTMRRLYMDYKDDVIPLVKSGNNSVESLMDLLEFAVYNEDSAMVYRIMNCEELLLRFDDEELAQRYALFLLIATFKGDCDTMLALCRKVLPDIINYDPAGINILDVALYVGDHQVIETLVELGANIKLSHLLTVLNRNGGDMKVIDFLLDRGRRFHGEASRKEMAEICRMNAECNWLDIQEEIDRFKLLYKKIEFYIQKNESGTV